MPLKKDELVKSKIIEISQKNIKKIKNSYSESVVLPNMVDFLTN